MNLWTIFDFESKRKDCRALVGAAALAVFGVAVYQAVDNIDYFDNQHLYCILVVVGELELDLNRSPADSFAYRFDTAAADIGFGRIVDSFARCCLN